MRVRMSRRGFMRATLASGPPVRVLGANDRIRLGLIGAGERGTALMQAGKDAGAEIVSVCDAWLTRAEHGAALAGGAEYCQDYRRVLDRPDIDGVLVATFDNTHAQITEEACRAGKDVYVEKPMTFAPAEGLAVAAAVRETRRVVQVGMQQRSMPHFLEARQRFFKSGLIGRVNIVRTVWNANPGYAPPVPDGMHVKPVDLNWRACLGGRPGPSWSARRYFNRFAYSALSAGGLIGGLFVHMADVAHWYLELVHPARAVALGGIYSHDDGRDTPDTLNAVLEYPEGVNVAFESTLNDAAPRERATMTFVGSGGRLSIFRWGYRFVSARREQAEITCAGSPDSHVANWLDCMRTRSEPNAGVAAGHYAAMACHMSRMALEQQSRVDWRRDWELPEGITQS